MTTLKLDAKALEALIGTFDEDTKISLQRCVVKEIVAKSFFDDFPISEEIEEHIIIKKEEAKKELAKFGAALIEKQSAQLQELVKNAVEEMVLDHASFQINDELGQKLLMRLLRRSSMESKLNDYQKRYENYISSQQKNISDLKYSLESLLKKVKSGINDNEQMIADIFCTRLKKKKDCKLLENYTAVLFKDGYKAFHPYAYRKGIKEVVVNMTPRSGKHSNTGNNLGVINFGTTLFIKQVLMNMFDKQFFNLPKHEVVRQYSRVMKAYLGRDNISTDIFENLHDLGYLPIEVRALPEGTLVPYQVPTFLIRNTHEDFFWLPNMLETILSSYSWPLSTSATTSFNYLVNQKKAMLEAGMDLSLLPFMCHDFSMRGDFGPEAAILAGLGHLASFAGTDTIPAMLAAEEFYGMDIEKDFIAASVDATEHACTCTWIEVGEKAFVEHLMNEASPKGILSIVSDTWDFWNFVTEIIPSLKDKILARDGKIVLRPDSGDPADILCGRKVTTFADNLMHGDVVWVDKLNGYVETKYFEMDEYGDWFYQDDTELVPTYEVKGLIEVLWDIFGGTETNKGYKLLDEHIGAIYGDSITLERQKDINSRLMAKGFAPQVVLGIGSYSYQYVTRDTHGFALKATNARFADRDLAIQKNPKTDTTKKSACGLITVTREDDKLVANDRSDNDTFLNHNLLVPVFRDGELLVDPTLSDVREVVQGEVDKLLGLNQ